MYLGLFLLCINFFSLCASFDAEDYSSDISDVISNYDSSTDDRSDAFSETDSVQSASSKSSNNGYIDSAAQALKRWRGGVYGALNRAKEGARNIGSQIADKTEGVRSRAQSLASAIAEKKGEVKKIFSEKSKQLIKYLESTDTPNSVEVRPEKNKIEIKDSIKKLTPDEEKQFSNEQFWLDYYDGIFRMLWDKILSEKVVVLSAFLIAIKNFFGNELFSSTWAYKNPTFFEDDHREVFQLKSENIDLDGFIKYFNRDDIFQKEIKSSRQSKQYFDSLDKDFRVFIFTPENKQLIDRVDTKISQAMSMLNPDLKALSIKNGFEKNLLIMSNLFKKIDLNYDLEDTKLVKTSDLLSLVFLSKIILNDLADTLTQNWLERNIHFENEKTDSLQNSISYIKTLYPDNFNKMIIKMYCNKEYYKTVKNQKYINIVFENHIKILFDFITKKIYDTMRAHVGGSFGQAIIAELFFKDTHFDYFKDGSFGADIQKNITFLKNQGYLYRLYKSLKNNEALRVKKEIKKIDLVDSQILKDRAY